jgi:universal stress protein A
MYIYKHILVAVDASPSATAILKKAGEIARVFDSKLSIIHVIEPLSIAYGSDVPLDLTSLQEEIFQQAREKIKKSITKFNLSVEETYIMHGYPDQEIHQIINDTDIDLLVLGSHGKGGFLFFTSSTSTDVMHGITCDMLAIHIEES